MFCNQCSTVQLISSQPPKNNYLEWKSQPEKYSHIHFLSVLSTDLESSWNAIFALHCSAAINTMGNDSNFISRIMEHKLWRKEHDLCNSPTKIQRFRCNDTQNVTQHVVSVHHKTSDPCQPMYATAVNATISRLIGTILTIFQCNVRFTSPQNQ